MNNPAPILTALRTPDTGLPDMPAAPKPNPIDAAVLACIERLQAFRATRIPGEPTRQDAKDFNQDIDYLGHVFDGVMNEVGHEAKSIFGLSEDDRLRYFEDRVFGAFDGEGTTAITRTMEQREEDFRDSPRFQHRLARVSR